MRKTCCGFRGTPWSAALLVAVSLCGCVKNKVLVVVNKEGGGTIVVTKAYSKEAVDMMNVQLAEMRRSMGARSGGLSVAMPENPFFDEKAIKKDARKFGAAKFVKARKIETCGTRGYVAVYSFKDINDIFLDIQKMGTDLQQGGGQMNYFSGNDGDDEGSSGRQERGDGATEFKFTKGASPKLEIISQPATESNDPAEDNNEIEEKAAEAEKDGDKEEQEALMEDAMSDPRVYGRGGFGSEMMTAMFVGTRQEDAEEKMYKGAEFSIAVEVDGEVLRSTASHMDPVKKNRILLMDVNVDKVLASPNGKKLMGSSLRYGRADKLMASLNKVPGASMETNRTVVVEFK